MTSTLEQVANRLQAHAASHPVTHNPVDDRPEHEKYLLLFKRGVITEDEARESLSKLGMDFDELRAAEPNPHKEMVDKLTEVRRRTREGRTFVDLHQRGIISEQEATDKLRVLGRKLSSYN
jgi:predicted nucleotidyltransferase